QREGPGRLGYEKSLCGTRRPTCCGGYLAGDCATRRRNAEASVVDISEQGCDRTIERNLERQVRRYGDTRWFWRPIRGDRGLRAFGHQDWGRWRSARGLHGDGVRHDLHRGPLGLVDSDLVFRALNKRDARERERRKARVGINELLYMVPASPDLLEKRDLFAPCG